ncbi:MAG: hypothetical protein OEY59_11675, partial [Deltaproteobacteria bacterium]|nr:hypothetical protein [Deltaproteobacteria bacterium]
MRTYLKKTKILFLAAIGLLYSYNAFAVDEPFIASITILAPLAVVETAALNFPTSESLATTQTVVVAPTDAGAATFNITGAATTGITASIVEASLSMINGASTIVVDTFTFG